MSQLPSSDSPSHRILLIDDNKQGLLARKAILEGEGYQVITAASAQEGLSRLAEEDFTLIVTDHKMPKMTGVELIQAIRKQSLRMPVILLSGFADTLGLNEENTGADVVIQKSANEVSHMLRAVRRLLRQSGRKKPAGSAVPHPRRVARNTG